MYSAEDRHSFLFDVAEARRRKQRLSPSKKYEDIVKDIFKETEKEMFMGGKLMSVYSITDDILFINSKHRMDANMMATLQKYLNGKILHGSVKGDVLIILCGVRHYSEDGEEK